MNESVYTLSMNEELSSGHHTEFQVKETLSAREIQLATQVARLRAARINARLNFERRFGQMPSVKRDLSQ